MSLAAHRRTATRTIVLDRSLEALPLFRLSDSVDDSAVIFAPESGGRWRVLPTPGDRVPGTFDQDVYVELLHRYHEANCPDDGVVTFTLHAFLRSIGRRVDGRTYEQLRAAHPGLPVIAYGNSVADLPHMRLCEEAVYINASAALAAELQAAGIQSRRWR